MLSPIDIQKQEFTFQLNGYSPADVDRFMRETVEAFDLVYQENADLKHALKKSAADLARYERLEETLGQSQLITEHFAQVMITFEREKAEHLTMITAERALESLRLHEGLLQRMRSILDTSKELFQTQAALFQAEQEERNGDKPPTMLAALLEENDPEGKLRRFLEQGETVAIWPQAPTPKQTTITWQDMLRIHQNTLPPASSVGESVNEIVDQLVAQLEKEPVREPVQEPAKETVKESTPNFEKLPDTEITAQSAARTPESGPQTVKPHIPGMEKRNQDIMALLEQEKALQADGGLAWAEDDAESPLFRAAKWAAGLIAALLIMACGFAFQHYGYADKLLGISKDGQKMAPAPPAVRIEKKETVHVAATKEEIQLTQVMTAGKMTEARQLLDQGVRADIVDANGDSPLMWAVLRKDEELAKLLLSQDVSVNIRNKKGETPILWAAYAGSPACIGALLDAGAKPNVAENAWKTTPLMYAAFHESFEPVRLLLLHGADPNLITVNGWTALTCAAFQGRDENVKRLVDAGANPNVKTAEWGVSPLMYASLNGSVDTVDKLLKAGAEPNAKAKGGWTALMFAAYSGHPRTVERLLAAGARADLLTEDGWSALALAKQTSHAQTAQVLRKAGAAAGKPKAAQPDLPGKNGLSGLFKNSGARISR